MPSELPSSPGNQKHVRLIKALRESEILRELSELLASSLDLTHTLQVLTIRMTEVCNVGRCTIWLRNDATFLLSAYHTVDPAVKMLHSASTIQELQQISWPSDHPVIQRILQSSGILVVSDTLTEPGMHNFAERLLMRSTLLVALQRENQLIGIIELDNPDEKSSFSKDQQQLVRAIGQQAAVAIDNARLYQQAQEERKRAERLISRTQATYQVATAVNADQDLPAVLALAAQHLVRELDADNAIIALSQEDKLAIVSNNSSALLHTPPPQTSINPSLSDLPNCLAAAQQGKPFFINAEQVQGIEKHWYDELGLVNILIIPFIAGSQDRGRKNPAEQIAIPIPQTVGFALVTFHQVSHQLTPGQYAFAQDIATQCALAIDKAHLLTEARQAVMLATERANTLDAVFNAMTEGILVLDLEGKIITGNSTLTHFMGADSKPGTYLDSYWRTHPIHTPQGFPIAPSDFPLIRALRGEQMNSERFLAQRADGSERLVEMHAAPLFAAEGTKIGIVGAFRDISEQARVEQRIRRALDTMLHAAEAFSGTTDVKQMCHSALLMTLNALNSERGVVQLYDQNQQTFTPLLSIGFIEEEEEARWLTAQKNWLEPTGQQFSGFRTQLLEGHTTLVNAEQCPEYSDIFQHTMILAAPITHNNRFLGVMLLDRSASQATQVSQHQQETAIQPSPRRAFSIWDMAVAEGIAQLVGLAMEQAHWQEEALIARTNEASMRASNELKDEFLAITAHEFRTPLTVILAYAQNLARHLKKITDIKPEVRVKLQESIDMIETQTRQLTNIVNTFLEVARLNRGQIALSLEDINLEDILKEAIEMQSAATQEHQIKYSSKPGKRPYLLKGDRARILQIVTNLLQNAIKYSPLGGPITVSLQQRRSKTGQLMAEVSVQDSGIGIPQEALPHLFERFYRAPNTVSNQIRGIGLGLYVVAEFLHLHGGSIRVESRGVVGEGSRFIFTLPLLESDQASYE